MQTRPFFECVDGWADIEQRKAKAFDATLMTCSMTNTFTAVARLQLVQQRTSGFDDETNRCLPASPKPTHRLPGEVAEQVKGQSCRAYVRANIFSPLGISVQEMDFVIADPTRHPAHATAYCCANSSLLTAQAAAVRCVWKVQVLRARSTSFLPHQSSQVEVLVRPVRQSAARH